MNVHVESICECRVGFRAKRWNLKVRAALGSTIALGERPMMILFVMVTDKEETNVKNLKAPFMIKAVQCEEPPSPSAPLWPWSFS